MYNRSRITKKDEVPLYHYVMLVDDDEEDCEFFSESFVEVNAMCLHIVNSGTEMFEFLSRKIPKPQLIFLDLNMPVKNGYKCLKELKANDELSQIPVVIYSTSGHEDDM